MKATTPQWRRAARAPDVRAKHDPAVGNVDDSRATPPSTSEHPGSEARQPKDLGLSEIRTGLVIGLRRPEEQISAPGRDLGTPARRRSPATCGHMLQVALRNASSERLGLERDQNRSGYRTVSSGVAGTKRFGWLRAPPRERLPGRTPERGRRSLRLERKAPRSDRLARLVRSGRRVSHYKLGSTPGRRISAQRTGAQLRAPQGGPQGRPTAT